MTDAIRRARTTATMVLEGRQDPLLACRELADLREELAVLLPDAVMDMFVAVSSEAEGLPIGPERAYWGEASLRVKDLEASAYREQVRSGVEEGLRTLLEATERDSRS